MKKFLSFLFTFTLCFAAYKVFAAGTPSGYEIKIRIKDLPDTTFYLASFYAKNQYYKDTARTDKKGYMVFSGDDIEEGMYSLVYGNRKVFDFLIIEKHMSFETDTVETLKHMVIKGSKENEIFFQYITYLSDKEKQVAPIREKMTGANEEEKKELKKQLTKIDLEVDSFQRKFIEENKNTFAGKFFYAMREIDVPEPPKREDGSIDSMFQYNYFHEHYFDHIDFTDARYLRTPVYHQRLSNFIEKYNYQIPDSLIPAIDFVIDKAKANKDLFRYTVSWITNTYENSKIMGLDAIFIHMAEKYYLTDQVDWVDSAQKEKIRDHYVKNKPLQLGKIAPNIVLADTSQSTWYNLHNIESEYLLVYIWSPTCGHCKKVTPKMHEVYLKYKDHGLKVFAVSTELENDEWKRYIQTNNLTWINVSDSPENPNNIKDYPLNYRTNYDVFSTPKIFLLDKDKKIIAKRIENEQLDDFLGRLTGLKKDDGKGVNMTLEE